MASHSPLQTLKEILWPGYARGDANSLFLFRVDVSRDTGQSQIDALGRCLLFLEPEVKVAFDDALRTCPPLRKFLNLKLFEAPVKLNVDNLRFQIDLCTKFVELNSALTAQRKHDTSITQKLSKDIFDDLCRTVVDVLEPSVFADPQRFPSLSGGGLGALAAGSAKTSSWWGTLGVNAMVGAASALLVSAVKDKYDPSSYTSSVADVGDLAFILPLAFESVLQKKKLTKSKMITMMLAAAGQIWGTTRGVETGTWGRLPLMSDIGAPPTLPLNCLPIIASLYLGQPKVSTLGLFVANGYRTAQDYVNIPSISNLPDANQSISQTIEGLLDIFTERTKSTMYLANFEGVWGEMRGFSDLKENFILPYLMDPVQISNKFLSILSSIEKGKYKELAKNLLPSIEAYFRNLSGKGGKYPSISVVKGGDAGYAAMLGRLDAVVASKLENEGGDSLIRYINGPADFSDVVVIADNIKHFVDNMKYRYNAITPENAKELTKLLAQENFLEGHHVQQLRAPLTLLLFSMFQGRNPEFRTVSETFLKAMLNNQKVKMNYEYFSYMGLVVELSTRIFDQPAYCQIMDKEMMGVFDDRLFYRSFVDTILIEADKRMKSRDQYTNLKQFHFASVIEAQMFVLPVIQTKLVKELALKIKDAATDLLFSVESKAQILKNMYLIDNPRFEKRDGNCSAGDLLNLDDTEESVGSSQLKGHHWRMMRLFALIRSKSDVMDASDLSKPFYSKDLEIKFNEFYGNLYQECIECVFPSVNQSVFLLLWNHAEYLNQKGHNMSYEFLREMYEQNKSIFWIPVLGLVIQDKPIPQEYWQIAKQIQISDVDAASYFDFLCRWVYPLNYNSTQRSKLSQFLQLLSEEDNFAQIHKHSHYLSKNLFTYKNN